MAATQQQEIMDLRALNLTPKQIARKLGIKIAEVNAVIQNQAQQTALTNPPKTNPPKRELDPIYQCLVSKNLMELLPEISPGNSIKHLLTKIIPQKNNNYSDNGLGLVVIARETEYNQISVSSCLLDIWCLGVKDAIPPRTVDRIKYQEFVEGLFQLFPGKPQEVPLEVAQGIIFSACEYAASLGFKPHEDFKKVRSHIGEWDEKTRIECGRNGKPFYVSGPYDNPKKIIATLMKNKGKGNFDFILRSGMFEDDF
jgi:hypothetical protein